MNAALKTLFGLAVIFSLVCVARGEDKKVVTLKGTITCAKCDLKKEKVCTNAIVVKDGDKEVVYYLDDNKVKEDYHKKICRESKPGSVKGVVSKKKDQMYIKPEKDGVKFDE